MRYLLKMSEVFRFGDKRIASEIMGRDIRLPAEDRLSH